MQSNFEMIKKRTQREMKELKQSPYRGTTLSEKCVWKMSLLEGFFLMCDVVPTPFCF